jgi:hypothetical protein
MTNRSAGRLSLLFSFVTILGLAVLGWSQGNYMAQLRGVVMDKTGAMVRGAKLTVTEDATNVARVAVSDDAGRYIFTALRPSTYTLRVEAAGFEPVVNHNIVLAVSQQADLDFTLKPAVSTTTVEVVDTAPLLDVGSASLGTEVTNEFISRMPLLNRDVTQLVYLSAGVTSLDNAIAYPYGTTFMSNGQRYGSAEVRLDGTLATGPEQGEGATSNLSYVPSSEVIQEFKVQNNSFAAEYGSNGGTVVNVVMKSGTNKFHGSGWWFGQRTDLNANSFYNNLYGVPRTDYTRDQYGFSLGGPIFKGKTFFLIDMERVRQNTNTLVSGRVPTDLERSGDFSQTIVPTTDQYGNPTGPGPVEIFNPFAPLDVNGNRQPFPSNVIPPAMITQYGQIGQNLAKAYPEPTQALDTSTWTNFAKAAVVRSPSTQFDVKIDHELNNKMHLMGRYSQNNSTWNPPGFFYDGEYGRTITRNVVLEYTLTLNPRLLWTSRLGLDRYYMHNISDQVDPTQFGLSPLFEQANGLKRMPWINVDDYNTIDPQCCIDTINGHTQYIYSSSMSWVHGKHAVKFGGEQRPFLNNFWQPDYPTGLINFSKAITAQAPVGDPYAQNGSGLASMLLGFPNSGLLNIKHGMETKALQTDFYIQDDWKVSSRLTFNLGLRYEWSVPYTERYNRIQYSDYTTDTGINVNLSSALPGQTSTQATLQSVGVNSPSTEEVMGTTVFPTSGHRHIPVDWNNWGPRLGFAYQLDKNTVVRGGAGVFYGMSNQTNYQYSGPAFQEEAALNFATYNGSLVTQTAWLDNPFPNLPANTLPQAQATKYGALAEWGYNDGNNLSVAGDHNPDIYQWNLGVQHLFPMGIVISADYSANRSAHLPWGYQGVPDALPDPLREQLVNSPQLQPNQNNPAPVSTFLGTQVSNPFYAMFQPGGEFAAELDSRYTQTSIPLNNLLNPYPQFDGAFGGAPLLTASSWYNGMLVRFQKRPSHGLSFEGNFTWSKATDDSSYGANNWIYFGGSGQGSPQDAYNLRAEHSISANDTPKRFVLATVYDLPFGRKRWLGSDMNRILDAIVGGWSVNPLLTFQSGQPIPFTDAYGLLAEGTQRPNITCSHLLSGMSLHTLAFSTDPTANYFNTNCFSHPGDQIPGNAPRFSANARGEGLKNLDMGVFKDFTVREGMKVELRAEFFNLTNSTRFAAPSSYFGSGTFGIPQSQLNSPRTTQVAVRFEF